jgi:MFS family permease
MSLVFNRSNLREEDEFHRSSTTLSSSPSSSKEINQKHYHHLETKRRLQIGMTIALSSSYFAVMGAKCALPSVLSLLTSPQQGLDFVVGNSATAVTPQMQMAQLLRISTVAIAAGKLLLGPVIDAFGGIKSLQVALTTLMILLLVVASSVTFSSFASCWVLVDFIFSACWAACINAIHQSFPQNQWSSQIGFLASGARMGNTVAFAFFGAVLYRFGDVLDRPWRVVFVIAAILQVIPLALLSYFGDRTLKYENYNKSIVDDNESSKNAPIGKTTFQKSGTSLSYRNSLQILRREACKAPFWFHLVSRACLMVYGSFLLFVPTLMNQIYGCSLAYSNFVGSIYAFGALVSVSIFSQIYSSLSLGRQVTLNASLLLLATMSSVYQLLSVSGKMVVPTWACVASLVLWAFSSAPSFYLPSAMYALEKGGKLGSATIADSFDLFGFVLLAIFNGYVGSIDHIEPSAWIGPFLVTTSCGVVSLGSLSLALLCSDEPNCKA